MQIFGYFHRSRLLPIITNNERMKLVLGIPDLRTYLISRLLKLKIKYENIFHENLNIYDKLIEITFNNTKGNILYNSLKNIGNYFEYYIHEYFRRRINNRIYTWYIDGDFLLLKFMCHRGAFRKDINEKCLLCEEEGNGIKHVLNNCKKLKKKEMK